MILNKKKGRREIMNNEKMGKGVVFERIRRITGYLVGTLDKWNNAKKAEEKDRVKHGMKKENSDA
jgi:anaerobic ribonucleoside-triphosphate reductase